MMPLEHWHPRATLVLRLGLLLALTACGAAAPTVVEPTQSSTLVDPESLPQGALINVPLRFGLSPVEGYEILDRQAAQPLAPTAQAGMSGEQGSAVVFVERLPGVDANQYMELMVSRLPFQNVVRVERSLSELGGFLAVRLELQATDEGRPVRVLMATVVRDEWAYCVRAWTYGADIGILQALLDAFVLLEGEIDAVAEGGGFSLDARGWTSEITAGRFLSAVSSAAVTLPPQWYYDASTIGRRHDEREVVFRHRTAPVYGLLRSTHVAAERHHDHEAACVEAAVHELQAERLQGEHTSFELRRPFGLLTMLQSGPFEYGVTCDCAASACVDIRFWYPSAARAEARAAMEDSLPQLGRASHADRRALRERLTDKMTAQRRIGEGYGMHDGALEHFAYGFRFKLPNNELWLMDIDGTRGEQAPFAMTLRGATHGISATIIAEPTSLDDESYHTSARRDLELDETRSRPVPMGQAQAHYSETERQTDRGAILYRLYTSVRDGVGVRFVVWADPLDFSRHRTTVNLLVRRFVLRAALPAPSIEVRRNKFTDFQFGYSVGLPHGWATSESAPPTSDAERSVVTFNDPDGATAVVLAIAAGDADQAQRNARAQVLDAARGRLGGGATAEVGTDAEPIAGRPSRRFAWTQGSRTVEVFTFEDGGVIYGVIFEGITPALRSAFARGFSLR